MPGSGSKSPPRCWPPSARRAKIAPGAIVQVGTSPWVYWLIAIDVVLALLLAGGVVLLLRRRKQAAG